MRNFFLDSKRFTSIFTAIIGLLASMISVLFFFTQRQSITAEKLKADAELVLRQITIDSIQRASIQSMSKINDERENFYRQIQVISDSLLNNGAPARKTSLHFEKQLQKLRLDFQRLNNRSAIDSLSSRLKSLEDALMQDPGKALALPLLQNQIQNLKEAEVKDIADIRATIATIYDQNKWFIGLMFTLAIGMISMAVANFVPKKDKTSPGNQGKPS
jgi:hypothetical protein